VVGAAGVFWVVGAVVGGGARLALALPSINPAPPQRIG
jgi:hypothetical protein